MLRIETDPNNPIEVVRKLKEDETNNVAEYEGLLLGIRSAMVRGVTDVQFVSDSRLVVEQVLGAWQCKESRLKMLCAEARELARGFQRCEILHVPRDQNKDADELVTKMLDEATGVKRH